MNGRILRGFGRRSHWSPPASPPHGSWRADAPLGVGDGWGPADPGGCRDRCPRTAPVAGDGRGDSRRRTPPGSGHRRDDRGGHRDLRDDHHGALARNEPRTRSMIDWEGLTAVRRRSRSRRGPTPPRPRRPGPSAARGSGGTFPSTSNAIARCRHGGSAWNTPAPNLSNPVRRSTENDISSAGRPSTSVSAIGLGSAPSSPINLSARFGMTESHATGPSDVGIAVGRANPITRSSPFQMSK